MMDIFSSRILFRKEDFPTLGLPIMATKPDLNISLALFELKL
jgi:hypothetical protein